MFLTSCSTLRCKVHIAQGSMQKNEVLIDVTFRSNSCASGLNMISWHSAAVSSCVFDTVVYEVMLWQACKHQHEPDQADTQGLRQGSLDEESLHCSISTDSTRLACTTDLAPSCKPFQLLVHLWGGHSRLGPPGWCCCPGGECCCRVKRSKGCGRALLL